MVSPEIDIIRTPPYYIWTIVTTAIGNRSLLDVSNWHDHLKWVCLNAIVLIVYVSHWTFRSLAMKPLLKATPLPQFCCYVIDLQLFSLPHCKPLAPALLMVLAQPFHSSLFSVHHSPCTLAPILSITPLQL